MSTARRSNGHWEHTILPRAREIVESYDTPVTLRQLFYRLLSEELLRNTSGDYAQLSSRTAELRRLGTFPELLDSTRRVSQLRSWTRPQDALAHLADTYYVDRTAGQSSLLVLGLEKATLEQQVWSWFGGLGVPIVVLRGYSSQSYVDQVRRMVEADGRDAHLLYAGDLDPSGEDIGRDFEDRTDCWAAVERIAVRPEHVDAYDLAPAVGKATDSRAQDFVKRHGKLVQVEVEALDPDDLRTLFQAQIDRWWDPEAHRRALAREARHRRTLRAGGAA